MNRLTLIIITFFLATSCLAAVPKKRLVRRLSVPAKHKTIEDIKIAMDVVAAARAKVFQRFIVTRSTVYLGMSTIGNMTKPKATIVVGGMATAKGGAKSARLSFHDAPEAVEKATYDSKKRLIKISYPWSRFSEVKNLLRSGKSACSYISFSSGSVYADVHSYIARTGGGNKTNKPKDADAKR